MSSVIKDKSPSLFPNLTSACNCKYPKGPKESFSINEVSYRIATEIIIQNHYLHRKAPCSKSYGLYCKNCKKLVGVIMYGISCSSTLLKGICGPEESKNVYELTRLWIQDGTPKNTESFFIGGTIKLLEKEIVVSFADSKQNHIGTIYQTTNFLYCGLSAKFKDPKVKGIEGKHHGTFANGLSNSQVLERFGKESVTFEERSRKHRYIYFNARPKRRKELLLKLRYDILPYPKKVDK